MSENREVVIEAALAQIKALMSLQRQAFCAHSLSREISLPHVYLLMALQERGAMTVSEIGQILDISAPSASSIIDRMEERGLVVRTRDLVDRRVVHVEIAAHGRDLVEDLSGLKRAQMRQVLSSMTDDELRQVAGGLQALHAALSRTANEAEREPVGSQIP